MNWRITALVLAFLTVGIGLWGLGEARAKRSVQNELSARYQQSFHETLGHVEDVEVLLSKGLAASTPEQVAQIFSQLRTSALAAQAELTRLPLLEGTVMRTGKFLTQIGDFSFTLAKNAAAGRPPNGDEIVLLQEMHKEARMISHSLHHIHQDVAKGRMPWEEIRRSSQRRLSRTDRSVDQGEFTRMEAHFEKIPVIQYDGPYSDHVLDQGPQGVTGDDVSEEEALHKARTFAPVDRDRYTASMTRRVEGKIPAYSVTLRADDDASRSAARARVVAGGERPPVTMDVTVKGGHVVWMLWPRQVEESKLGIEEAIEKAHTFLKERGFPDMEPTYIARSRHTAVIPFVRVKEGVRIYPDMVKVGVALDNGDVVAFEGMGYLTAAKDRKWDEPRIKPEEAKSTVSPSLTITDEPRLALIPSPTKSEVLTWEIPARSDDETYLIYVNATTGAEENILRLVKTSEGDLTL